MKFVSPTELFFHGEFLGSTPIQWSNSNVSLVSIFDASESVGEVVD